MKYYSTMFLKWSFLSFWTKRPQPILLELTLKCSCTVSFWINIPWRLLFLNIDDIICSLSRSGYLIISLWSISWYCFIFWSESLSSLNIKSKLITCKFSKLWSVFSRNSFYLFCLYQVLSPSLSYHDILFEIMYCLVYFFSYYFLSQLYNRISIFLNELTSEDYP